jgi:hypothetical protein
VQTRPPSPNCSLPRTASPRDSRSSDCAPGA